MALPSSGTITMGQVNTELGYGSTVTISLNDSAVRSLLGVSSGSISMSSGWGKSYKVSVTQTITGNTNQAFITTIFGINGISGPLDFTVEISSGVYVWGHRNNPTEAGLTIVARSIDTVNIVNYGYIIGGGGDGAWFGPSGNHTFATNGGPALKLSGALGATGIVFRISNSGYIAGGGGGGSMMLSASSGGGGAGGGNGGPVGSGFYSGAATIFDFPNPTGGVAYSTGVGAGLGATGERGNTRFYGYMITPNTVTDTIVWGGGGGGGRIVPGGGGGGGPVSVGYTTDQNLAGFGGGAGGGGGAGAQYHQLGDYVLANDVGRQGGGGGDAGTHAATNFMGGAGGGGWGAAGGNGSWLGGTGGAAILKNGNIINWAPSGAIYGAIT